MVQPIQDGSGQHRKDRLSETFSAIAFFVMTNMLWAICSLPIITMPAATAGLFAVMVTWVRRGWVEPLSTFFNGMRRYWLKSTLIMLLNLVIVSIVSANFFILRDITGAPVLVLIARIVATLIGLLILITNIYLWPLMMVVDYSVTSLLKNAARLAVAHFGWSLLVVVMTLVPLGISLFLPQAVFLIATVSAMSMIMSWGAWRVIRRYLTEEQLRQLL